MTPRQLKYFIEIARTGSITTAASTLHIAQPALSHHLAAMEEELGVSLLKRHARGVQLTVEGQRLLDRAAAILRQMDRLRDDVRDASTSPRGVVNLCIVGSVAPLLAIPLFKLLEERVPEVQLQLSTGMSREAQALVEARRVELALLPTAFELTRLQTVAVFEERFCLFGHRKLLKGRAATIAFRDIGDRPLVAPDRDHDMRKLMERTALAQNCVLNVRYEINNSELLRAMVREGMAFAVMPRNAFPLADQEEVVARDIVEPAMERTQSIVSLIDHPLTPAGEAVRQGLLDLVKAMVNDGTLKARLLT
ncbi:LysR family transcriptional regulator [Variovorax sp. J22R24]|uniref:LysR family transcriptional regulator n=1 Tax=Variovorax gracilis TaxID=3053502 RepID=UPI002577F9E3|nr:LysR family transcriptional regulator [Variovorax sp. J22R24]MDM0109165.1 LysR family transcriptional regulator [Variovorax sp. J22R24]